LHTGADEWWGWFPLLGFMTLYCSHSCIMLWLFLTWTAAGSSAENLNHNTWVIFRFWPQFIVYFQQLKILAKCGCSISATVKGLLILDFAIMYFHCDGTITHETFFLFLIKAKSLLQGRKLCPKHRNFWWTWVKIPHWIRYQQRTNIRH
jgi:hypothetical protein